MADAPNPIRRYMHPKNRVIMYLRKEHLALPGYKGVVEVPWDCICTVQPQDMPPGRNTVCRCDQRPTIPPQGHLREARQGLERSMAGLNLALEEAGQPQVQLVKAKG